MPNTLKALREARDYSQADLAFLVGVDPATISRVERGKQMPSDEVIYQLARRLGVELAEIIEILNGNQADAP